MEIINQSRIVLILIISYLLGLDLFGRSQIDTQETPLNVALVFSLLTFDKSPPKYYLISQLCVFQSCFFIQLGNSKEYKIVARDRGQFLLFKDAG